MQHKIKIKISVKRMTDRDLVEWQKERELGKLSEASLEELKMLERKVASKSWLLRTFNRPLESDSKKFHFRWVEKEMFSESLENLDRKTKQKIISEIYIPLNWQESGQDVMPHLIPYKRADLIREIMEFGNLQDKIEGMNDSDVLQYADGNDEAWINILLDNEEFSIQLQRKFYNTDNENFDEFFENFTDTFEMVTTTVPNILTGLLTNSNHFLLADSDLRKWAESYGYTKKESKTRQTLTELVIPVLSNIISDLVGIDRPSMVEFILRKQDNIFKEHGLFHLKY